MKEADFRSFLVTERRRLINFVRSLLSEAADMDAEDIVHDVLIKLLERADTVAPMDHLAAYTYRSLRNRVIDTARVKKPSVSLDAETEDGSGSLIDMLTDLNPNALEVLQTKQGKAELFKAMEDLSQIERDVIIAHEFEGTSYKELSQFLNVPQNTLLSHKARGLKKLKSRLAETQGDQND